jgi:trehalose 6-phosphate synthase
VIVVANRTPFRHQQSADARIVAKQTAGAGAYRLRYVWLSEEENRGYYFGFANEGLWPLCHAIGVPPVFRHGDFAMYERANHRLAAAAVSESATATSDVPRPGLSLRIGAAGVA